MLLKAMGWASGVSCTVNPRSSGVLCYLEGPGGTLLAALGARGKQAWGWQPPVWGPGDGSAGGEGFRILAEVN